MLSELTRQHDVAVDLLAQGVESVGGQNVGRLRVALRQPGSELKLTQVVDFLKQRGVRVERT